MQDLKPLLESLNAIAVESIRQGQEIERRRAIPLVNALKKLLRDSAKLDENATVELSQALEQAARALAQYEPPTVEHHPV